MRFFEIQNFKTASQEKTRYMTMCCGARKVMWSQVLKTWQLISQRIKLLNGHPNKRFYCRCFLPQQVITVVCRSRSRRGERVPPTPDNSLQNSKSVHRCSLYGHHKVSQVCVHLSIIGTFLSQFKFRCRNRMVPPVRRIRDNGSSWTKMDFDCIMSSFIPMGLRIHCILGWAGVLISR